MDDCLVATSPEDPPELHDQIITEFLSICHDKSLFLKATKCQFKKPRIEYLGLLLDGETVQPDPAKVEGLWTWPVILKDVKAVRSTLGVFGYQRMFIPGFAHIVSQLGLGRTLVK